MVKSVKRFCSSVNFRELPVQDFSREKDDGSSVIFSFFFSFSAKYEMCKPVTVEYQY